MTPNGYLVMTTEERVSHWVGVIYRQMRWAGEDGVDEVNVFDQRLMDLLRSDDPEIDLLMPSILTYLSRMWLEVPDAFLGKVNRRLGISYKVDPLIATAKFGAGSG